MKNEETAKRLRQAMDEKRMTAKELSDRSGVSEASISQYIHGTFAPRNITAAKLADILEVDPMWLMGFDVPMRKLNLGMDVGNSFSSAVTNAGKIAEMLKNLNEDGMKKLEEYIADLAEVARYQRDRARDEDKKEGA